MWWKRLSLAALGVAVLTVTWALIPVNPVRAQGGTLAADATFHRDVLPILQARCQSCHRSGEIAPMSLLTYEDARPWARSIKEAVITRAMPPWFSEPGHRKFANDPSLTDREIQTLVSWADSGAAEGNRSDAPPPVRFVDGWNIEPDMIIEMPKPFAVKPSGTVNYQNVLVKVNFPEDTWIASAEMRAGDRRVVHHMRANVRPPDSPRMKDAIPGEAYENGMAEMGGRDAQVDLLGKYNPGLGAQDFALFDSAKFVPKGSDIIFNLHYTAAGEEILDQSRLGLVFAKEPPKKRYFVHNGPAGFNLAIPPNARNAEVVSELTTKVDMDLVYLQPHMHLRGKDMEFRLYYPSGEMETVFKGDWNFDWQLGYALAEPIPLPIGTRMVVIAHYDNSANNPYNPDPNELVIWGQQNWEEMQNMFVGVLVDPSVDVTTIFETTGPSLLPRGEEGPTIEDLITEVR